MLIKFGTAGLARDSLDFRRLQNNFLSHASYTVALFKRYSGQSGHVDGHRTFVERREEAASKREECHHSRDEQNTSDAKDHTSVRHAPRQSSRISSLEFLSQPGLLVKSTQSFLASKHIGTQHWR